MMQTTFFLIVVISLSGLAGETTAAEAIPTTVAPEATTYDPCYNNPCQNGGTCQPKTIPYWPYQFIKYICQCDSNHYGQECQHYALGCQNGGYIDEFNYNGRCRCPVGTWGYLCQYESDQFTGKKIRLVGGMSNKGRVEVYHDGQWGTVCDDGFGNTEAEVVCRLLGYSPYNARVYGSYWDIHPTYGRIWLDDLRCRGNESSIFDCSHRGLGVHDCYHRQDARVECHNDTGLSATAIPDPCSPSPCQNGGTCVRTSSLFSSYTDYKCVCPHDRRGENCENSEDPCIWSPCQYGSCERTNSSFWPYTGYRCNCPFDRTGEKCENSIYGYGPCSSHPCLYGGKCSSRGNGYVCDCPWGRFGKRCESNESPVRLVGGRSNREGRVEVYDESLGSWGTVCDDGFDDNAARVICRSLGFGDRYAKAYQSACFGQGIGWIHLDGVNCTGDEHSLIACKHQGWDVHDCGHSEDVSVSCGYSYTRSCPGYSLNGTIKAPETNSSSYDPCFSYPCRNGGTCVTQVSYDWPYVDYNCKCPSFKWGKICQYYSRTDPCTSNPCFYGGTCVPQRSYSWRDDYKDYNCACPWDRYGRRCEYYGRQTTDNPPTELTTAYGQDFTGKKIRLVGGGSVYMGRVEVYHDGQWGTVCDNGFDNTDAQVVCRMLGYSPYNAIAYPSARFGQGRGPIWLDDLRCRGYESSVFDCSHGGLGVEKCGHSEDAGVSCNKDITAYPEYTTAEN